MGAQVYLKAKRTPARGVKKNLKPCTYKQWEPHHQSICCTALTERSDVKPIKQQCKVSRRALCATAQRQAVSRSESECFGVG
ncbi:hypothetical protein DXN17_24175 [Salmonella enterica subsp. enterica serovar Enteritidis]|nr:hypothetical protein DXN17_24175 [Salmonella enterica subsp. enterica serovar Enteritidis]